MVFFKNKAEIGYVIVFLITSVLGFVIYLNIMVESSSVISNSLEDNLCRQLIISQDTKAFKIADFFLDINKKCVLENIKISVQKQVYPKMAESMKRCWYRYGEGEYDFLSNYNNQGNWCFICSKIDFDDDLESDVFLPFNDFILWSSKNSFKLKNGTNISYSDYINFKYSDVSDLEILDLEEELEHLKQEKDSNFKELLFTLSEQKNYLQDLRLKKIDFSEQVFVVYRYDRLSSSSSKKIKSALMSGTLSLAAGITIGSVIESALWSVGSAAVCTGTSAFSVGTAGFGSFSMALCAGMVGKTVTKVASSSTKSVKAVAKFTRISKIANKIKSFIKFTKKSKIASEFAGFSGKTDELFAISKSILKVDSKYSDNLLNLANDLKKLNVENIYDVDLKILKKKKRLDILQKSAKSIIDNDIILDEQALRRLGENYLKQSSKLEDFRKVKPEIEKLILKNPSSLTDDESLKLSEFVRGAIFTTTGMVGVVVGYNLDFDYNQYVDLMTKEQYFRICGTYNLDLE